VEIVQVNETVHAEPSQTIEDPRYRVNFWERSSSGAWSLDAFVLSDVAEVTEALTWATENARGRRMEVFVETTDQPVTAFANPRTSDLIRLAGANPNEGVPVKMGSFVKLQSDNKRGG
jgi:hypothetical protein